MRVAVIGAGYVGLVTSACLAEMGHRVTCLEVVEAHLASLRQGQLPIYEPDLADLVRRNVASGRLSFAGDYSHAVADAAFAFIAVPTPPLDNGQADTRHVFSAARSILEQAPESMTIVVKSTVPVGTGDDVARLAVYLGKPRVRVVSNPEFLRQGSAVIDFFRPDRVVIGADEEEAGQAVARLYDSLDAPILHSRRRSAEMAKYAANALLATRISFMNEVAAVCDATGADVQEVARIVGADERIGPHFLRAGLGWGGSCFPKDVLALAATASMHGTPAPILEAVLEINDRQRDRAAEYLLDAVLGTPDASVAVLGLAFKPDTDDLRGSPALEVIGRLLEQGVHVRAHDPVAMAKAEQVMPGVTYAADAYLAVDQVDAVLLATEWRDYLDLDWIRIRAQMRGNTLIDGRNVLDETLLRDLGFNYLAFGRGAHGAQHELLEPALGDHGRQAGLEMLSVARPAARTQPVADSVA